MQKGFTVLELLVVIAIIGILSSVILVSYNGYTDKARIAKTLQWASSINHSLGDRAVGAWTFDNISGATVYDDSGNNNNGTAYGGPAVVNGVIGKALSFDGVDDYVIMSSSAGGSLNPLTAITIEAWLKPAVAQSGVMVSKNGPYGFFMNAGRTVAFWIYAGSPKAWDWLTSANTIPLQQWSHVAGSYDGTTMRVYINGVLGASKNHSLGGNMSQGGSSVYIGYGNPGFNQYFNGSLDDVRIFSAAFTQAQIQQHYADGLKTHQNLAVCDSVSF